MAVGVTDSSIRRPPAAYDCCDRSAVTDLRSCLAATARPRRAGAPSAEPGGGTRQRRVAEAPRLIEIRLNSATRRRRTGRSDPLPRRSFQAGGQPAAFLMRASLLILWLQLNVSGFRLVLARGWHGARLSMRTTGRLARGGRIRRARGHPEAGGGCLAASRLLHDCAARWSPYA
jgi:hypothetical protein